MLSTLPRPDDPAADTLIPKGRIGLSWSIAPPGASTGTGPGAPLPGDSARPAAGDAALPDTLLPSLAGAVDLLASVLASGSADSAARRLVAGLAREFQADCVSLGWHRDGRSRVAASTTPDIATDEGSERGRLLRGAMDEAIDQGLTLCVEQDSPVPPAGALRARPITLEHAALRRATGNAVVTVPVGDAGRFFAVVCLERRGSSCTPAEIERLENLLVLAL
ncbi:MAG TPA: GAF domain-containing protein, partial [Burkholderiaceae bacterium]|nr:GAF domain-containing protein [Burkholderiaceae bacterium]